MYLHRDTQHGVYGVVITYTGVHNLEYRGVLIDIPTQGHTTRSIWGAHRYIYTGAHNIEYRGCS